MHSNASLIRVCNEISSFFESRRKSALVRRRGRLLSMDRRSCVTCTFYDRSKGCRHERGKLPVVRRYRLNQQGKYPVEQVTPAAHRHEYVVEGSGPGERDKKFRTGHVPIDQCSVEFVR